MRWRDLVGEATRNVGAGSTRAVLGILVMTLIGLGFVLTDALTAAQLLNQQRAVVAGGGATHIVLAHDSVLPQRCLALRQLRGVAGVIALRETDRVAPLAMPHTKPATYEVAGDVAQVLQGTTSSTAGVWLSEELSSRLGPGPIPLADGNSAQVLGTFPYPSDGRSSQLAMALLQPVPAEGHFDACWITIWPPHEDSIALLETVLEPGTENATTALLNPQFGQPKPTTELLRDRPTRALLLLGLAVASCVGFALVWSRRVELSLALHLGVRPAEQHQQLLLETLIWALPTAALTAVGSAVVSTATLTAEEARWLLAEIAVHTAALFTSTVLGAAAGSLSVREHKLFGWAKDR